MRLYTLTLVLKPSLGETERKKIFSTISSSLKPASPGQGGEAKVASVDDWGQKALSYPIKKEQLGYFYQMMLETTEKISPEFEDKLKTNENILRHLLVRSE